MSESSRPRPDGVLIMDRIQSKWHRAPVQRCRTSHQIRYRVCRQHDQHCILSQFYKEPRALSSYSCDLAPLSKLHHSRFFKNKGPPPTKTEQWRHTAACGILLFLVMDTSKINHVQCSRAKHTTCTKIATNLIKASRCLYNRQSDYL